MYKYVLMYLCHIFDRTGFRIENAYTHNGQITNPTERIFRTRSAFIGEICGNKKLSLFEM